jgi:hypothetical protein
MVAFLSLCILLDGFRGAPLFFAEAGPRKSQINSIFLTFTFFGLKQSYNVYGLKTNKQTIKSTSNTIFCIMTLLSDDRLTML